MDTPETMKCDCAAFSTEFNDIEGHYSNCSSVWTQLHPGKKCPKEKDGTLRLPNEHILRLNVDVMHHLGLDTLNYDLPAMFGDIKFVCMGGTKERMKEFAEYMSTVLNIPKADNRLVNLTKHSHRFAMYKVGPVLSVNHGIGIPSMITQLQEVIKLMYYAKAKDPIFFRVGSSGGINIPPGSVVISTFGLSSTFEKFFSMPVLGKVRSLTSVLDKRLALEMKSVALESDGFQTHLGGTMAADDFYRGQGRLDGPFCDYTDEDKNVFLKKLTEMGVKNIEMEATAFAALTSEAGLRAGIVCVTFVNRMITDQITSSKGTLKKWQTRPMVVVGRYIAKCLQNK